MPTQEKPEPPDPVQEPAHAEPPRSPDGPPKPTRIRQIVDSAHLHPAGDVEALVVAGVGVGKIDPLQGLP